MFTRKAFKSAVAVSAMMMLPFGTCQAATAIEYGIFIASLSSDALKGVAQNNLPCIHALGTARDNDNDKDDFGVVVRDGSNINVIGCQIQTNASLAVKSNASLSSVASAVNPGNSNPGISVVENAVIRPSATVTPVPEVNQNQSFDYFALFGSALNSFLSSDTSVCDAAHTNLRIIGPAPATLTPGTYCGGIFIKDATVALMPGIYIMRDGDFTVRGNSNVTTNLGVGGGGAMLVFSAVDPSDKIGNISVITNGTFSLKAGKGLYAVFQYVAPDLSNSCGSGERKKGNVNEISAKSVEIQGVVYAPHKKLILNSMNNSNPSPICSSIHALAVDLSGNLSLGNDNDGCKALFAHLFPTPPSSP